MKYWMYLLFAMAVMIACDDDDDHTAVSGNEIPVYTSRVKKITGYNEHWKDYTLEFVYTNNKIKSVNRRNKNGRVKGVISVSKEDGLDTYSVLDYVPAVDADSIQRLDKALELQYGAGNYSLEDSIPLSARTLYDVTVNISDGKLLSQAIVYYIPKEESDFGLGDDFDNRYTIDRKETYFYEFGLNGEVLNTRYFLDTYIDGNDKNYTRELYKSEYVYENGRVVENNLYYADSESEKNWTLKEQRKYAYAGKNIQSVQSNTYKMECRYTAELLTSILLNGVTYNYKVDSEGKCLQQEVGETVMTVEYEEGSGNFSLLYPLDRKAQGFPVIY